MSKPKAYAPEQGYMFQILVMCPNEREYEHCDYAKDKADKKYLLGEYRLAYGAGFRFKTETLPQKYWKEKEPVSV
ncbi:hypothetical protein AAXB25_14805 [Paenibacillus lautus]|uniref:hypothetical protein n=1 Tax=Paenibacillus lautus TaxID=1401 RepID=UPI003D2D9150